MIFPIFKRSVFAILVPLTLLGGASFQFHTFLYNKSTGISTLTLSNMKKNEIMTGNDNQMESSEGSNSIGLLVTDCVWNNSSPDQKTPEDQELRDLFDARHKESTIKLL